MNNRGLLLYHQGAINAHLDLFELIVRDGPFTLPTVNKVARNAEDAIRSFNPHAHGVAWLSGPAATRKLAKVFGLTYRTRAPGAGRKKTPKGAKAVSVPMWLTPAGKDRLDKHRGKAPRGQYVEGLLPE